jgi:hypothetical protein
MVTAWGLGRVVVLKKWDGPGRKISQGGALETGTAD